MYSKVNRTWRVVLVVLVLLVCFRLALPYIITRYVDSVLNQLEWYRGEIDDVDVNLFKSTYRIDTIRLYDKHTRDSFPIAEIPMTEITIDWSSVLKGTFGSEVNFHEPHIKISENNAALAIPTSHPDWLKITRQLSPIAVSRIRINDGQITYRDSLGDIILLQNVQMDALNLHMRKKDMKKGDLPSRIYLQALSVGNGQLNIAMKLNLGNDFPELDMDVRFENIKLEALNTLLGKKTNYDIKKGNFNLLGEISSFDGHISGFLKPIFTDLSIASQQKDVQPPTAVWMSFASLLREAESQQHNKQYATRVMLEGNVRSANSPFLPAVWNIFSNALIAATSEFDDEEYGHSASTTSISEEPSFEEPKSKREIRKEKRREKREERKRQKRDKD